MAKSTYSLFTKILADSSTNSNSKNIILYICIMAKFKKERIFKKNLDLGI